MKFIYNVLIILILLEIFVFSLISLPESTGWNLLWMVLSAFALVCQIRYMTSYIIKKTTQR